jgi:hypothetical protein
MKNQTLTIAPLPYSWNYKNWPTDVPPFTAKAARRLVYEHRTELVRAGAITRIGRKMFILGAGYAKFLASGINRVEGFEIAPNRKSPADQVAA